MGAGNTCPLGATATEPLAVEDSVLLPVDGRDVASGTTVDLVGLTIASLDPIAPAVSVQPVEALSAGDPVASPASANDVLPAAPLDHVGSTMPVDDVVPVGADQPVRPTVADHGGGGRTSRRLPRAGQDDGARRQAIARMTASATTSPWPRRVMR